MTCGCSWTLPSAYPRYQIIGGEVGNGKQHRCDGFSVLIHGAQNPRGCDYSYLLLVHDSWLWISMSCLSIWSWEVGEPHGREAAAAARGGQRECLFRVPTNTVQPTTDQLGPCFWFYSLTFYLHASCHFPMLLFSFLFFSLCFLILPLITKTVANVKATRDPGEESGLKQEAKPAI